MLEILTGGILSNTELNIIAEGHSAQRFNHYFRLCKLQKFLKAFAWLCYASVLRLITQIYKLFAQLLILRQSLMLMAVVHFTLQLVKKILVFTIHILR